LMWNERTIGKALQHQVFNRAVCMVDNCLWTGFEADLLIVEPKLRIIDVEIKISRADLKADFHKDKWREFGPGQWNLKREELPRKLWPRDVWKHYYAVPEDIWTDELLPHLGSPNSGVLLLREANDGNSKVHIRCYKRTKPNKAAKKLTPAEVLDVARLATLRLWNTYEEIRIAREDNAKIHAMYSTPDASADPNV
jgi:hypothetical protein